MASNQFSWNIGTFLLATIAPPILIGGYFFIRRPSQSPQDFIFGKYELHFVIVGLSLSAFVSAPFILLLPMEILYSGTTWVVGLIGFFIGALIVAVFHAPPLHYSRATSLYQYIEDRYRSKTLRYILLIWQIITNVCYCVCILTLTSLFAKQIIPIEKWMCSACLTVFAVIGTISGGQKAVACISVLVFVLEGIVSLFCLAIAGLINEKSWASLSINSTEHLLPVYAPASINDLNVWYVFGATIVFILTFFGSNQIAHQHYCSLQTKRRVRISIFICVISFSLSWLLCCAVGLLLWQYYITSCHFSSTTPSSLLDIVKLFYSDSFLKLAGFFGYLIGSLVALVYCTIPAGLTSLAACTWEDLVKLYCSNAKEHWHVTILRLLIVFYACVISLASFLILELVDDVWIYLKNILVVLSSVSSPVGALFLMAVWLPCTNKKGAFIGLSLGLSTSIALAVGYMFYNPHSYVASIGNHLCCPNDRQSNILSQDAIILDVTNETIYLRQQRYANLCWNISVESLDSNVFALFKLPLILHPILCFCVTFVFGLLFSFLTGGQDIYALDWNLVYFTCNDLTAKCQCFKPESKRRRKRSHLASAYATSDSFRYSRQGPFPDNSYHNPNVQTYWDTLTKK